MKDGFAVCTMRGGKNISLWPGPNVKGNGLPLIADALLWMSCFLGEAAVAVAKMDTRWSKG